MKRFLLVCGLLALISCTKDLTENGGNENGTQTGAPITGEPTLAIPGRLDVKLTPEAAAKVVAAQLATRGGETDRSGIIDIDQVLEQIGATNFERVIPYDAQWEPVFSQTGLNRWYYVQFDEQADMEKAARSLAAQPGVMALEYSLRPEYVRTQHVIPQQPIVSSDEIDEPSTRADETLPTSDKFLKKQWHYNNTGSYGTFTHDPAAGADVNLFPAWKLCTGNPNVIVAVIDEPVYTDHPDLQGNIWSNPSNPSEHGYNFRNQSDKLDWTTSGTFKVGGTTYNQYADHGTHVAGVIAAVNDNEVGVSGIAGGKNGNGVKIMSCQTLGFSDDKYDPDGTAKAFVYAMKNGAIIAQNSWGFALSNTNTPQSIATSWKNGGHKLLQDAIDTFINGAGSATSAFPNAPLKGGLVIFAAGNDGDIWGDVEMYPAAYRKVIAVGSMSWDFRPAYYTDYGGWVDITAPGGDALSANVSGAYRNNGMVYSTILCDNSISYTNEYSGLPNHRKTSIEYGYGYMQGTSMACPHVSGVAALGLSYAAQMGKQYTVDQFRALLLGSVYGIDSYFTGSKEGSVKDISDVAIYKNKMGGGCVDALKLLLAIKGTPAIYVKTGQSTTVDFARFFGGNGAKVTSWGASSGELLNIGLITLPVFNGTKLTLNCPQAGAAIVTIGVQIGDTQVTRDFAIVSRAGLADNGGWL